MGNRSQVCLITGANSGIGYSASLELAKLDMTVVMICRNSRLGIEARDTIRKEANNNNVYLLIADLSSQESIFQLVCKVKEEFPTLNILINNAGAMFVRRSLTIDGLERTLALNHIAYFMLANHLLPTLQANAPARIINVGSFVARNGEINFTDLQSESNYDRTFAYQQSKLANLLFTTELSRRTQGKGITVNYYNPGNVITNFGGILRNFKMQVRRWITPQQYKELNIISVEQAGQALAELAYSLSLYGITGKCFSGYERDEKLSALDNIETASRLWHVTENLLKYPILK